MKIQAVYVKHGQKVHHPEHGTFIVSKYRWHYGQGVEFFDQDQESIGVIIPFKQEIEVSK